MFCNGEAAPAGWVDKDERKCVGSPLPHEAQYLVYRCLKLVVFRLNVDIVDLICELFQSDVSRRVLLKKKATEVECFASEAMGFFRFS